MIYKIKYMHGDADGYTTETIKIEENYKNKLIKEILEIFKNSSPEWKDNFLYEIDDSIVEEYLIENYDDKEDTPELWDEVRKILREERANMFLNILKDVFNEKEKLNKYELEELENLFSLEGSPIEKNEFYKKIFNVTWNLSDIDEILISDITCEDRFAKIEKIQIKNK